MEKQEPKSDEIDWGRVASFIETIFPHAKPLIEEWIGVQSKNAENQAEINRLSHQIAKRQLLFETLFIFAVLAFSGAVAASLLFIAPPIYPDPAPRRTIGVRVWS